MKIKLKIGSNTVLVDDKETNIDVEPFLKDGRTFVPIRFIAETMGYTVEWNEVTQEVTISDEPTLKHANRFKTLDECAVDFAMCYNPLSIGLNREISALITEDEDGYFYTNIYLGQATETAIQKKGYKYVSDIHTHGSAGGYKAHDTFSSTDKSSAKKKKIEFSYLVSPYGNVQKYNTATKKIEFVSKLTPFDVKEYKKIVKQYPEVKKNIAYFKQYFGAMPSVDAEDNKYTTTHLAWCNQADKFIQEYWEVTDDTIS